jgi:hypothetical protein
VVLAAVRDEFVDRAWDPPGRYWDGQAAGLVGGRDRVAGGTWLAVDPAQRRMAALLNGVPLGVAPGAARPSRGGLPIAVLTTGRVPDPAGYDGYHLMRATTSMVEVWSWDGIALRHQELAPGDHVAVNAGVDAAGDPLVPHVLPLLRAAADPDPRPGLPVGQAWGDWLGLLAGDGLDPAGDRALIVRKTVAGRTYASTSATLLALGAGGVRYDFTATPGPAALWHEVTS